MKRRAFLGLVAAAPLGAKAAAASLADLAVVPGSSGGYGALGMAAGMVDQGAKTSAGLLNAAPDKAGLIAWIAKNGFPDFIKKEAWDQAKYVSAFDPDIAVNRSMSLSAKLHHQRTRNYKTILAGRDPSKPNTYEERENFFKKFNFWL